MDVSSEKNNKTSSREIICGDSINWLNSFNDAGLPSYYSIFTSLPDISEMPLLFGNGSTLQVQHYKDWLDIFFGLSVNILILHFTYFRFQSTIALIFRKLAVGSCAIFLQSDVRVMDIKCTEVLQWIDKSHMCSSAADSENCTLLWHKLVLIDFIIY